MGVLHICNVTVMHDKILSVGTGKKTWKTYPKMARRVDLLILASLHTFYYVYQQAP